MPISRKWPVFVAFFLLNSLIYAGPQPGDSYGLLLDIHEALNEFSQLMDELELPDCTLAAAQVRSEKLRVLHKKLDGIDPERWEVSQRVDYRLVRARLRGLEFQYQVTRPWARDPGFYLDKVKGIPYAELPLEGEELLNLRHHLDQVAPFLQQAQSNLTEASGELARLALDHLRQWV